MAESRRKLYADYKGTKNPSMDRTFLQYDRYAEANDIRDFFKQNDIDLTGMMVLDYGSGVGDYGMTMAREGARVSFFDFAEFNDFVSYRCESEGIKATFYNAAFGSNAVLGGLVKFQLAIFGEVLEHLPDPLGVLTALHKNGTQYLFTSSYPYRGDDDEDYWSHPGHEGKARGQQPACRELLESRYKKVANFGGQFNLWKLRS